MNADAELDAALGRQSGVALDEAVLHLDRAAHRVDHAAKLDQAPVAGALDDPPAMGGDGGVDQVASQAPKAREGAILVRSREPAIADDIGDQDGGDLAALGHDARPRGHTNLEHSAAAGNAPPVSLRRLSVPCRPARPIPVARATRLGSPDFRTIASGKSKPVLSSLSGMTSTNPTARIRAQKGQWKRRSHPF